MSGGPDVVVLGSSSGVPTRRRNHSGLLLRLGGRHVVVDPGEGTQRQLTYAGASAARIELIAITHFHGDHCLGLPGLLSRADHDGRDEVAVAHPTSGAANVARLRDADVHDRDLAVTELPVDEDGDAADGLAHVASVGDWRLSAATLDHRAPCVGWRLAQAPRRSFDPDALAEAGIEGPDVGRLQAEGVLATADGRVVELDDVSEMVDGPSVAVVQDTAPCDGARRLAADVDLLVIEATYADEHADLAQRWTHLTARQAGQIAAESGARRVLLTHVSPRYEDVEVLRAQAAEEHDDVTFAHDLDVVAIRS